MTDGVGKVLKGEITIFLAMMLGGIMIFIYALLASLTVSSSKSCERGNVEMAMESVFAEYHKIMLDNYHVFALESTYETGEYDRERIRKRLQFYGADTIQWDITQLQLLTDCQGAAYEEQILAYMKQKYGVLELEDLLGDTNQWDSQRVEGETTLEEGILAQENLLEQVSGIEEELETQISIEDDTLGNLLGIQKLDILTLAVVDESKISETKVDVSAFPSHRTLETGVACYQLSQNSMGNKFLIDEYMVEHFVSAADILSTEEVKETETLQYELEYLLAGGGSDRENLKDVVNQLLVMRTGVNYLCLARSPSMVLEAEALALTIATATGTLALEAAIKQVILLGWSYSESVMDIRSLLEGNRIEFVKTEANWQLGISSLMDFGTEADQKSGADVEGGLSYEDYLRMLLLIEKKEDIIIRSLDMIEQNLKINQGLEYFQVDYCVTQLEYLNTSAIMYQYQYEFPVAFTYR